MQKSVYLEKVLGHVFAEVLDERHLLLQLWRIVGLFADLLLVLLVQVSQLFAILVEYNSGGVVVQHSDRVVRQCIPLTTP